MQKNILEQKLIQIHQILDSEYPQEKNLGVLNGLSGISLFQFYYSKYLNIEIHADIGVEIISNCIKKINTGYSYPTFCTGIAGLGWVCDHLEQENFIEIGADTLLSKVDDFLYKSMVKDFNEMNYDYLHGGLGYALYFIQRYKSTNSLKMKNRYKDILFRVINFIEKLSIKEKEDEIKWLSIINIKTGEKACDLSLSHGMSSIIGVLTKLHEQKLFKEKTERLLNGAVNYILSLKSFNKNNLSLFPNTIPVNNENIIYKSRVAWCYGDLGIALRLWFASKTLKNEELKSTAISIFKHVANRTKQNDTMVKDASICHGSFGNSLVFNRIHKETNIEAFKTVSDFWIQDGIDKAIHTDGYAGYKQFLGDKWKNELNILEGIAGIGLVIIDKLASFDTNWDECLMIS